MLVDFAHFEIFWEDCFEACADTPIYGKVERGVDYHEEVDQGEDVEVPDLQVPLVVVVASQHRIDSDGLVDVCHDSEMNVSRVSYKKRKNTLEHGSEETLEQWMKESQQGCILFSD